jgi:predicted membrane-bound mannosyltransferase/DNA-binding beta-propeller fold protein YncE
MSDEKRNWLDRTPVPALPWLTTEVLVFSAILLLAIFTRFYNLGTRVMSHDESLHTYFSYEFYQGRGYQHNPMMHGPLQFHLIALSYFIFGASDFTARIPAAVFSVATILALWSLRRYLGRTGMLAAAAMALISPYLLYYGRYTREDPYVGVSLIIMFYAILRYFETGTPKYIYILSAAVFLHFSTKETAFIYTAEMLVFLAVYFLVNVTRKPWEGEEGQYRGFVISLIIGFVLLAIATGVFVLTREGATIDSALTAAPANPSGPSPLAPPSPSQTTPLIFVGISALAFVAAGFFLVRGYTWEKIREERSFDLLIVFGTLVLPQLAAFPVFLIGWNPVDYSTEGLLHTSLFLVPFIAIAIAIGLWWKKDVWWRMALIFWGPYVVLYTTLFTNGIGFFTGVVGSLGYWLEQQGVERGSQPIYFYVLVQVPMYEYLPALASVFAYIIGSRRLKQAQQQNDEVSKNLPVTYSLLAWWSFSSLVAFSVAGEKMPWLTFHITLPLVLFGGWAIGSVVERVDWEELRRRNALLVLALVTIFILSIFGIFIALLGSPRPFEGTELNQLQATTSFVFSIIGAGASAYGLFRLLDQWDLKQAVYLNVLVIFGVLAVLTVRTTIRANYKNYDSGQEYLVYAHSFTGVKDVLRQVMDLSDKTTGDPYTIAVAYDDDVSWPMSWYMRNFPNARYYGNVPDMSLREVPAIIVGDNNFNKIEPIVGDNFYRYDYVRMVWPNQDYFNLVSERPDPNAPFDETYACQGVLGIFKLFKRWDFSRLCNGIGNPEMRAAIFDIWLNRDYKKYSELTGSNGLVDSNWQPSDRMRLYIRKDVADLVWSYGIKATELQPDPYAQGMTTIPAGLVFGSQGSEPGQLNAPRGLAFAPDGSIYVADSRNHRIQHFTADGQLLKSWGTFADIAKGEAPLGTFNEPWGVAVGPDGAVYVTDTWNHRVQKFSKDGVPLKAWGVFGLSDTPGALYGPRGITVDSQGRVFVADTGNKRIVIFDSNGTVMSQFGTEGFELGQFNEPVDVKLDAQGNAYVTDTWNQRVQVFNPVDNGTTLIYTPALQWPIRGWKSQSLDNKPYIAVSSDGHVFVTDPEGFRVIEFTKEGQFVRLWGTFGTDASSFGLPSGIAIDAQENVWVTDAGNGRVMRFTIP